MNEDIYVEWDAPAGRRVLAGDVQIVEDGPFEGVVLVREPGRPSGGPTVRVIDDRDSCRAEIAHWQGAADKGVIYRGDAERHNPEYRQAMADWWRKVDTWLKEKG